MSTLEQIRHPVEARFRQRSPRSAALFEQSTELFPGGDYRRAIFYRPYMTYMERGKGSRLWDVDGNEYIDYNNCWTAMVLGHAHPKVVAAIQRQAEQGTTWSAPTESLLRLAASIRQRFPSVERLRFACSGTEAVMFAVRAARAYTRRDKFMKMQGVYHGTWDPVEDERGGVPASAYADVVHGRTNDREFTERAILEHKDELAAVLLDVAGGLGHARATPEFVTFLREITQRYGIQLIVDEVVTFRLAWGGGQEYSHVTPDLTAFGKIIGGGFAIGAFGGREEVMRVYEPGNPAGAHASGTFVATPVTVAAGLATLEEFGRPQIHQLNTMGARLAERLRGVLAELEIPGQVTELGSLVRLSLAPPRGDGGEQPGAAQQLDDLLALSLLTRGFFVLRGGIFCLSTAMTEGDLEALVGGVREALLELEPALAEAAR